MVTNYDAIVVGAGHNGLTNAAYLARAGLKVLVLERNPYIGGAAVSREIQEGWIYSNCSYVCSLLRPELFRDLELAKHGLQVVPYGGGVTFTRTGDILGNYTDDAVQRREFARHNARDGDAYHRYSTEVMRQCKFIRPLLLRTPPDPTSLKPRDIREMIYLGKEFAKLGEQVIYDMIRFYSMSIADFLGEYFESDLVKAHLSGSGIIGSAMGVYSPGTAYVLLHHYMGDVDGSIGAWGFARGGMGAVSKAIASAFKAHGGEIITDAPRRARAGAQRPRHRGRDRERQRVPRKHRRLEPRPEAHLPQALRREGPAAEQFLKRAREFKIRGSSGKLNIALDGLPEFPALGRDNPLRFGDMHFLDSLERYERAYDDWKNGTWSKDPYLDLLIPSLTDPTMAPPGKHFMSVFVQYVPPKIHGARLDRRGPRRLSRHGARPDRALQPELPQPDPPRRGAHAARARERGRPDRGQHLPGRADDGPAAVQPPVPRLRAVPRADEGLLHVRLRNAPGRRRHGGAGRECRARDPARPAQTKSRPSGLAG